MLSNRRTSNTKNRTGTRRNNLVLSRRFCGHRCCSQLRQETPYRRGRRSHRRGSRFAGRPPWAALRRSPVPADDDRPSGLQVLHDDDDPLNTWLPNIAYGTRQRTRPTPNETGGWCHDLPELRPMLRGVPANRRVEAGTARAAHHIAGAEVVSGQIALICQAHLLVEAGAVSNAQMTLWSTLPEAIGAGPRTGDAHLWAALHGPALALLA